jgi:hypothetical protein
MSRFTFLRDVEGGRPYYGVYQCDCGVIKEVYKPNVKNGSSQSCGCLRNERTIAASTTHGHSSGGKTSTEYNSYTHAIQRCTDPKHNRYHRYGGRGIEFRFASFEEFINHIGPKPSPDMSVDRIDTNGHYELGNVRWATAKQQANNRSKPESRL